jgi:CAAX protease family protein
MDSSKSIDSTDSPQVENELLSFMKAFWLVFGIIVFIQIFQFVSTLIFGLDGDEVPTDYMVYSEVMAIIWYTLSVIFINNSIHSQNYKPSILYNFNVEVFKQYLPDVLKYFAGTATFIILLSFLSTETELQLENQPQFVIILSFVVTVIMAPIAEEIMFRGYLYSAMFSTFKQKKERLVVNAMIFSVVHVFVVSFIFGAAVPYYIFVLGYLIALLYENSRSILPCIALHALNNALVFTIDIIKLEYF